MTLQLGLKLEAGWALWADVQTPIARLSLAFSSASDLAFLAFIPLVNQHVAFE